MSGNPKDPTNIRELLLPALGALLLLVGVGVAAVTEKGQVDYQSQIQRHGGDVLDMGTEARPDSGQQGYMVRVVGPLQVVESPRDEQFNQQSDHPVLYRHVDMFQWHEVHAGSTNYDLDWRDRPIDSSQFEHPEGHANPGKFPLDGAQFDAGLVRIDDFVLAPALVHALPGTEPVIPNMRDLPTNLAASFSLYNNTLVTSANPANPQLGDIRISWDAVPLQTVTIVAKVDGNKLVPATDAADGAGYAVQLGDIPLTDIFPDLPYPPELIWLRRVLAILLAIAGTTLLLRWYQKAIDPVLVPAIAVLPVGLVAAVLWLGHDNSTAMGWLALALVGLVLTAWRWRAYKAAQSSH